MTGNRIQGKPGSDFKAVLSSNCTEKHTIKQEGLPVRRSDKGLSKVRHIDQKKAEQLKYVVLSNFLQPMPFEPGPVSGRNLSPFFPMRKDIIFYVSYCAIVMHHSFRTLSDLCSTNGLINSYFETNS